MINLHKVDEPEVLKDKKEEWLADLMASMAEGDAKKIKSARSKYNHAEIKDALILETNGKCAYCESYVLHVAPGDIEHITPKSLDLNLTFRWSNLTLACGVCNNKKSNVSGVIDPYIDDIAENFEFLGPMIVPKPISDKAVLTERQLQLNRLPLVEKRLKRISSISTQVALIFKAGNEELKRTLIEDLVSNDCSSSAEYSAFCRNVVLTLLPTAFDYPDGAGAS